MSFLQPAMLIALPIIALPIIIHLINQRRFQTVQWAAMHFLLAANRMSRGYARIRQWLILAARTLAVAGLIFAISRPLSSGWLGLAGGGHVDTTIILIDRSASMTQRGPSGVSKLDAGIRQLSQSLSLLHSSRYVLVDSANAQPVEFDSPDRLADLPEVSPLSQSADIPAMLEVVSQYIQANRPSRCEVWICSDVRQNDWDDTSGRWDAVRNSLIEMPQMIRFHLLAYPDVDPRNRSLRLTGARRVQGSDAPRLLLSMRIDQSAQQATAETIPIQLELDGARSEFSVEMTDSTLEIIDHAIPLNGSQVRGWGRVSIPSDASPADDEFFFVYDEESVRTTMIVAEDETAVRPLEFATSVTPDPEVRLSSQTISPQQLLGTSLQDVSLLVWQAPLPEAETATAAVVDEFLNRGGQAIFFPPASPSGNIYAGLSWGEWQEQASMSVATWVSDQDLLAKTRSGRSLPVGEWKVSRYCTLSGDRTSLATLNGGAALLARAATDQRNVYFCTTTADRADSSLATDGVVLYAMLQRAVATGAQSLGNTRQYLAGNVPLGDPSAWVQHAGNENALSNTYPSQAGVYKVADKLLAINRPAGEDVATTLTDQRVDRLFEQLEFDRVDDSAGSGASLIQEIWRLFLFGMLISMLLEAVLCLPRPATQRPRSSSFSTGTAE